MIDAYGALKRIVVSGRFVLTDVESKIDTLWVEDDLTGEQRAELKALAEANYDPTYNPAPSVVRELQERVTVLEQLVKELNTSSVS